MKFLISVCLCAALSIGGLLATGCVSPTVDLDTGEIGVMVSPLASQARVAAGEKAAKEFADATAESLQKLAAGQATLAEAMGEVEVAKSAMSVKLKSMEDQFARDVAQAKLDVADKAAIDWTTIILATLGVSVGGTGAVAGVGAYRKKLLAAKPPAAAV